VKVLIFDHPEQAVARVADQISAQMSALPHSVLGLATGGTMEPVYARLAQLFEKGDVSFARATSFNLDEYVGLAPDHPCSYHVYMNEHLFSATDFDPSRTHLPKGDATDPHEEARRYDAQIAEHGQIDLQLLGLGANGHIGFNEPTSSLGSRTRVKTLTASTLEANKRFFQDGETPPKYAITMGVQSVMDAKSVILLATGAGKAAAVAQMVEGPLGAYCPATVLQMHADATIVLDQAAASGLKLTDYYFQVHPNGKEEPIV